MFVVFYALYITTQSIETTHIQSTQNTKIANMPNGQTKATTCIKTQRLKNNKYTKTHKNTKPLNTRNGQESQNKNLTY